jgi:membrane-bound ClpP family serine protease
MEPKENNLMNKKCITLMLVAAVLQGIIAADTFTHRTKDIVYHGFAKQQLKNDKNVIITPEQGPVEINSAEYDVAYNATGRNNMVSLLTIADEILYDYETKAFEEGIVEEADKGPLFILIEIDTPGGEVDLCKRLCAAITALRFCPTVAYIKGGKNGGAYSAGAAVSLACDKIYMAPATSIGAATSIAVMEDGQVLDMKEAFGDTVGEKFSSAWRSYFASLAQRSNHSGAIARAMVDKDISVIEVQRDGQALYVESKDKRPSDTIVRTLCKPGELLTLSASEAVACGVASGVAESRQVLLAEEKVPNAPVVESQTQLDAKEEFEKVVRKFNTLVERLDLKFKEIKAKSESRSLTRRQAMRDFEAIIKNAEYLLKLKRTYPDIPYEEETLIGAINSYKAEYNAIKAMR